MDTAVRWFRSKLGGDSDADAQIDSKTPTRINKLTTRLIQLTTNKRLNLKNSPPYLQGILIDTQELINKIFKSNSIEILRENDYLPLALYKVVIQTKKTTRLFRDAGEEMENEKSQYRRELNKFTLVFSHMLAEFRTIFKGGEYRTEFKIVKQEPRAFWKTYFQNKVVVPWEEFIRCFGEVHRFGSPEESQALKKTVDLTENDHVSWFEFDIFTRLFQPWKQILNNWNVIVVTHPGYLAFMTYDEVEAILKQFKVKPGSYVFRLSCTRLGQWAIGFVTQEGNIVQTIPQSKSLYQALIDGAADRTYIYPKGEDFNPDITKQIRVAPEQHIQVTKEQYDIYCDMESAFEICKICDADIKSVRIDPCGHLLCKKCLAHWMEQGRGSRGQASCPFCREQILSTESIIVEPYKAPAGFAAAGEPSSDDSSDEEEARGGVRPPIPPRAQKAPSLPETRTQDNNSLEAKKLRRMTEMGFDREESKRALSIAKGDINVAVTIVTS
eukprot:m.335246 g.335246  ORF g.335246 m.335246 type:complete len:498 (-) comp17548_c0_seq1:101-1594(-)